MTDPIEATLARHEQLLTDQLQVMAEVAELARGLNREVIAAQRMVMALAAFVAQGAPDPLAVTEALKRSALDSLPLAEDGSFDALREPLERLLATVEARLTKPK